MSYVARGLLFTSFLPTLASTIFLCRHKCRLEKWEAAGETVTALSAPGGAVPLSYPRLSGRRNPASLLTAARSVITWLNDIFRGIC